jgi:hypothetical protein
VLRGIRSDRESLHLSRDYVKHAIRSIVGDLCTRPLWYRTELDAIESERRGPGTNSFIRLRQRLVNAKPELIPTEDGWGGWLGTYQRALCEAHRELETRSERRLLQRRPHSLGR